MSTTPATTGKAADAFARAFAARKEALPGAALTGRREAAFARFAEAGLPTTRIEEWKYTSLNALQQLDFEPAGDAAQHSVDQVPSLLAESGGPRLVFVEGGFRADLSRLEGLPEGVTMTSAARLLAEMPAWFAERLAAEPDAEDALPALNQALSEDGFVLRVAKSVTAEQPIEMVFLGGFSESPKAWHPRNLVVMEENSEASLIEIHAGAGDGPYLANAVTRIALGQNARLHHVRLQDEGAEGFHLSRVEATQERDSLLESFGLALGARLSRNEAEIALEGPGANCKLAGAYLMRGRQHCDNTTLVEHRAPDTSCKEVFKGALDEKSRGVFQGRIVVQRDAQRIDGHQLSKALLLSDDAEMDAKPELEIYADDVQCSHGATTGALDREALFYLRSRGLPEAKARSLLVQSHLGEAIEEVSDPALREALIERVALWLRDAAFQSEAA